MGLGRKGRASDGRNIFFLFSYFFSKHEWHLCFVRVGSRTVRHCPRMGQEFLGSPGWQQ